MCSWLMLCIDMYRPSNILSRVNLRLQPTYKRHVVGRLGNVVGDEKQKDGERQQDGDAERDFLPGVRRQVEDEHSEERHEDARSDDVDEVVARFALKMEHESHCRERYARVGAEELIEPESLGRSDVPLAVRLVHVEADLGRRVEQFHVSAVVRPVYEVEAARLVVERVE